MSMNVRIYAERDISYRRHVGGTVLTCLDTQSVQFEAYQTPSAVSYEIVGSENPAEAYAAWVLKERSEDEEVPIYGEDDVFGDEEPVGYRTYNAGREHVRDFRTWLAGMEEGGYTVKFEVW